MKSVLKMLSASILYFWLILGICPSSFAADQGGDNYASIDIPIAEFGFRGIGEDGKGNLFVSSLLKNGVFLMPNGCRDQNCATFIELSPPLSAPGRIVPLPDGGAFVLQRFGDRIVFVPRNCRDSDCTKTILLPNRPSYPSAGTFDPSDGSTWVSDELSDQVAVLPPGCREADCMSLITLPTPYAHPSGIVNDPEKGFWITEQKVDRIALVPRSCRATSCVKEFPIPSRTGFLKPFSPVALGKGRIGFLVQGGRSLVVGDFQAGTLSFHFIPLEERVGRATRILGGNDGYVLVATKGEFLNVGRIDLSESCLASSGRMSSECMDFRSIPIPKGEPFGLSQGTGGFVWITLRNRDEILRVRFDSPCMAGGKSLPTHCYSILSFSRAETIYHREYHQEVSK